MKKETVFFAYFGVVLLLLLSPLWIKCYAQKPTYNEVPSMADITTKDPDAFKAFMKAREIAERNNEPFTYEDWAYAYFDIGNNKKKSALNYYPKSNTELASTYFIVGSSFLTASVIGFLVNDLTFENWDPGDPPSSSWLLDREQREKTYNTVKYVCYGTTIIGGIILIGGGVHLRRASLLVNENGVGFGINLAMKKP